MTNVAVSNVMVSSNQPRLIPFGRSSNLFFESGMRKLPNGGCAPKFRIGDPLEDLGWRIEQQYRDDTNALLKLLFPEDGEDFFAHEHLNRVLMPLDGCSA